MIISSPQLVQGHEPTIPSNSFDVQYTINEYTMMHKDGFLKEEFLKEVQDIFKPSKLTVNADFHLFKTGIEPKWEDPECANGGKWTVTSSRKANLETMWLETVISSFLFLMALVGEQFDDSEDICGVVASVRRSQDKLSLWTKTATNEAAQMGIGRKWKEIIDTEKISYSFHDDSKRERSAKSRYTV
ncbi:Eukaryotic translation initiation factor isoform 4E-2 [Capsicum annuum]|uniref:Eukaryotic translation initiation factor isoform 4E n=1 Tax=Capsicum annuum TaxID=4072 RepID=A0A2G2ZU99_CAPAN|nr:Eukaryotic translation initiation factor isoform 4E-2 [Capsicum annuum]